MSINHFFPVCPPLASLVLKSGLGSLLPLEGRLILLFLVLGKKVGSLGSLGISCLTCRLLLETRVSCTRSQLVLSHASLDITYRRPDRLICLGTELLEVANRLPLPHLANRPGKLLILLFLDALDLALLISIPLISHGASSKTLPCRHLSGN